MKSLHLTVPPTVVMKRVRTKWGVLHSFCCCEMCSCELNSNFYLFSEICDSYFCEICHSDYVIENVLSFLLICDLQTLL